MEVERFNQNAVIFFSRGRAEVDPEARLRVFERGGKLVGRAI